MKRARWNFKHSPVRHWSPSPSRVLTTTTTTTSTTTTIPSPTTLHLLLSDVLHSFTFFTSFDGKTHSQIEQESENKCWGHCQKKGKRFLLPCIPFSVKRKERKRKEEVFTQQIKPRKKEWNKNQVSRSSVESKSAIGRVKFRVKKSKRMKWKGNPCRIGRAKTALCTVYNT